MEWAPQLARLRATVTAGGRVLGALDVERLRLRAMALTYLSLFALVPALVVAFSVVQAFAGLANLAVRVDEFLIENLAVGARNTIEPYLSQFVKNAHAGSAGLVGGALLLWSAGGLLRNVEGALNEIWRVERTRSIRQAALTYWATLTLGPLLLAGSLTLGHAVSSWLAFAPVGRELARAGGILLTCVFFALIYLIVPAAKVQPRAAMVGGLLAGFGFEAAKTLYAVIVTSFFSFNKVYGSIAAVPIFLLWIHLSWSILLFGARIAFVAQHARVLVRGHAPEATPLGRERLAALVMLEVARAFHRGGPPALGEEVAARLDYLPEPVRETLTLLRAQGLLLEAAGGGSVPARPLDQITLAHVRRAVSGPPGHDAQHPSAALVEGILDRVDLTATESLDRVTYAQLCDQLRDGVPPGPAPQSTVRRVPVQG